MVEFVVTLDNSDVAIEGNGGVVSVDMAEGVLAGPEETPCPVQSFPSVFIILSLILEVWKCNFLLGDSHDTVETHVSSHRSSRCTVQYSIDDRLEFH